MKKKIKDHLPALILMIVLITLDQITKMIARNALSDGPYVIIDGVFELKLLFNTGVAWGMFNSSSVAVSAFALVIMALVVFVYIKIPLDNKRLKILRILMVLIFAGAAGNIIDRVFYSAVTDFLYFKLIDFPVFNVADCYVTVSGILTAILLLTYYRDEDLAFLSLTKKSVSGLKEDKKDDTAGQDHKEDTTGQDGIIKDEENIPEESDTVDKGIK